MEHPNKQETQHPNYNLKEIVINEAILTLTKQSSLFQRSRPLRNILVIREFLCPEPPNWHQK